MRSCIETERELFDRTSWAHMVEMLRRAFGSHSTTGCWLSLLPEARRQRRGCHSTHLTSAPWPSEREGGGWRREEGGWERIHNIPKQDRAFPVHTSKNELLCGPNEVPNPDGPIV